MKRADRKQQNFSKLLMACREHDTYSLSEICLKMDISYEQLKAWAKKSDKWLNVLEMCQALCDINAERAALMKRIPIVEALKYISKNSYVDQ
ncbi:MAG: hypothetical protein WC707_04670 [Candidatus Babeliaceae bacterium]|jgi:hypothetical protein